MKRLGGSDGIEAVAANDAEQHVTPSLPSRLPAQSLCRPRRGVQGMGPHVLWVLGLDRFPVDELGKVFKGLGRALDAATQIEPRAADLVPSTKGTLVD